MITFKLNKKKVQFPSTWYDLDFKTYLEYMNFEPGLTEVDIISKLIGIPKDKLMEAEVEGLEAVLAALSFLREPHQFDKAVTQIGPYKMPLNSKGEFNIQYESLAQFEDLRAIITKSHDLKGTDFIKLYADMVAIYLQKVRDGKYQPDKAKAMVPEIMGYPAHEVITAGSFFFVKLWTSLTGTATTSQSTPQTQKKKTPVSPSSQKSSGRSPRSRKSRKS